MNAHLVHALTGYLPHILPEAVLAAAACLLFLGGAWRAGRALWGWVALAAVALAAVALWHVAANVPTVEDRLASLNEEVKRATAVSADPEDPARQQAVREAVSHHSGSSEPAGPLLSGRDHFRTKGRAVETDHMKMQSLGIHRVPASGARHGGGGFG